MAFSIETDTTPVGVTNGTGRVSMWTARDTLRIHADEAEAIGVALILAADAVRSKEWGREDLEHRERAAAVLAPTKRLYVAVIEWNGDDSAEPAVIVAHSPEGRERGELAEIIGTLDQMAAGFHPNLTSDACALAWQEMGYPKIEDIEAAGTVSETLSALLEADGPFVTYSEVEESEIHP